MEYIIIIISAVFVNNIVLTQVSRYMSVSGGFQKDFHSSGNDRSRSLCYGTGNNCYLFDPILYFESFKHYLPSNYFIYSGYCIVGSTCRNYIEKSQPITLPGSWSISSIDYNKLCYFRCSYSYHTERIYTSGRCCLCN